jgi:extracellular elastinolytic metalloproteinase
LTASDMRTFRLRRDYVDISGTHHLSWTQSADGVAVFGNGLQAAVTS